MDEKQTAAATCEIELKNGDLCRIPAVYRCTTCGRAYCRSHQAWWGQTFYIDQCAPCFAKTPTQVEYAKQVKIREEIEVAKKYFQSGDARTALLASGVKPVDLYWIYQEHKFGLFGLRDHFVDVTTPLGRGWILGTFRWEYEVPVREFHQQIRENWLTALLEDPEPHDPMIAQALSGRFGENNGLIPVESCSGGYKFVKAASFTMHSIGGREESQWKTAEQAVKRLIGS
jgi:hypothetical protein